MSLFKLSFFSIFNQTSNNFFETPCRTVFCLVLILPEPLAKSIYVGKFSLKSVTNIEMVTKYSFVEMPVI